MKKYQLVVASSVAIFSSGFAASVMTSEAGMPQFVEGTRSPLEAAIESGPTR